MGILIFSIRYSNFYTVHFMQSLVLMKGLAPSRHQTSYLNKWRNLKKKSEFRFVFNFFHFIYTIHVLPSLVLSNGLAPSRHQTSYLNKWRNLKKQNKKLNSDFNFTLLTFYTEHLFSSLVQITGLAPSRHQTSYLDKWRWNIKIRILIFILLYTHV